VPEINLTQVEADILIAMHKVRIKCSLLIVFELYHRKDLTHPDLIRDLPKNDSLSF
jgi:hypothetical protein